MTIDQLTVLRLLLLAGVVSLACGKPSMTSVTRVVTADDGSSDQRSVVAAGLSEETAPSRSKRSTCSTPPVDELRAQWLAYHTSQDVHPSYYVLPPYREYIGDQLRRSHSESEFLLYGQEECPSSVSQLSAEHYLQDRALCPWYSVVNHDPDRYPPDLAEARCKCTQCVGLDPATGTGCEPVYYNIPVLRRTDSCLDSGAYRYEKGWQRIAVGCTCSMDESR